MRRTTRLIAWGSALALVAGLTACATTSSDDAPKVGKTGSEFVPGFVDVVTTDRKPVAGGTLTFADYSEARSLDPIDTIATGASGGAAVLAVYDVLVRYDDATGDYEPWLAEAIEPDATNSTWTLTLREGVRYSDGTTMKGADVVASINRFIHEGGSDAAVLAANIKEMTSPDDRTVVFSLAAPWAAFPRMLSLGAGMIVAPGATEGKRFTPIGAGPFALEKYVPSEELVLAARADYWGGAPHLEKLRFVWPSGGRAALDALRAGDVDVAFLREPNVVAEARSDRLPGYLTLIGLGSTLWINNRDGRPGEDLRVRQAISLAINAETVTKRTYGDASMPTKNIFGPQSRWWLGEEKVGVDLKKAAELVAEAKADGYDGKLTLLSGTTTTSRTEAVTLQAMLDGVGFEVKTELVQGIADRIQRMYVNHDFDITMGSGGISEADPFHQLNDNLSSTSYLNVTGHKSERMDAALAELQGASDDAERARILGEIQQAWVDEVPAVNVGSTAHLVVWNKQVHGVVPNAEYMMLFSGAWHE